MAGQVGVKEENGGHPLLRLYNHCYTHNLREVLLQGRKELARQGEESNTT